ncbi:MAG: hypothetical protein K2Z80_23495 [Xanthobacteraceae bacterium]|nr:hypothetical protein [Xanthobacteraceae bacterium]
MRTFAYALVALSLGTIASSPAAAQCHGPECEGQRPPMPYYFTEREGGARGGFETPPPPPQQQQQQQPLPPQQREPTPESEQRSERSEAAPPPPARPRPAVRPPGNRSAGAPPGHRSAPHDGGRPQYRVEGPPPRYDGPRSGPSRHEAPRYETSRSEPPRYQGPRYETSRSEPPSMRYDGTDRWPPGSSYSGRESIPSAPDDAQRYSYSPDGRSRITVYSSRDRYDGAPPQQYSGPPTAAPRGGTAAGPGQVVISVEEYRALQGQARELQRLLGERGGGTRVSRPGPGPNNGYPGTSYR